MFKLGKNDRGVYVFNKVFTQECGISSPHSSGLSPLMMQSRGEESSVLIKPLTDLGVLCVGFFSDISLV
jgi:hypothetical protein